MSNATWKNIASGKIDPVYLLMGVEQHIFDSTIERLIKALPNIDEDSVIRIDLEETDVETVIEEADTLPFLQDYKLIIASNASFLSGKDKREMLLSITYNDWKIGSIIHLQLQLSFL